MITNEEAVKCQVELINTNSIVKKKTPNFNESIFEEITGIKVDKQA